MEDESEEGDWEGVFVGYSGQPPNQPSLTLSIWIPSISKKKDNYIHNANSFHFKCLLNMVTKVNIIQRY